MSLAQQNELQEAHEYLDNQRILNLWRSLEADRNTRTLRTERDAASHQRPLASGSRSPIGLFSTEVCATADN